ncbi:nucleotidyltransferase family protein [Clostridium sp. Marseille-P299]|uniref:nucleotidyltransferase family protein n=1 Tax=Clostridium sp. Marseille-P299 TaxID=1805477 RepID=UPI00082C7209|nr:nucleotidyltransferase family protein [Clostridium sp. Marseille-P299]
MNAEKIIEEFKKSGKRHIFITGSSSMGKSTLCRELSALLNANLLTIKEVFMEAVLSFLKNNENVWISIDEIVLTKKDECEYTELIKKQLHESHCILTFRNDIEKPLFEYLKQYEDAYVINLDNQTFDVSCIVMASGAGSRFGSNKLLASFNGKTLIEHILDTIPYTMLKEVILVTRYKEVEEISKNYPLTCIVHDLPRQSDTIRIGMDHITDSKGCMFLTCDQPLRTKKSLRKLILNFNDHQDFMVRLGYREIVGNPVIFPNRYYEELKQLQPGQKGSTVVKAHFENMIVVQANHRYELADTDTMDDFIRLSRIAD